MRPSVVSRKGICFQSPLCASCPTIFTALAINRGKPGFLKKK